jgi:hypothetical protein
MTVGVWVDGGPGSAGSGAPCGARPTRVAPPNLALVKRHNVLSCFIYRQKSRGWHLRIFPGIHNFRFVSRDLYSATS